jgi:hypothetical protein
MRALTNAYIELEGMQKSRGYELQGGGRFIGLRDFYNFVKLLDRRIRADEQGELSARLLVECITRSFGGFGRQDMVEIVAGPFFRHCKDRLAGAGGYERPADLVEQSDVLALLRSNLADLPTEQEAGSRHLMVLSEHESALQVLLDKRIVDKARCTVLHGYHFPGDSSTFNMYKTINQVKTTSFSSHCFSSHCISSYLISFHLISLHLILPRGISFHLISLHGISSHLLSLQPGQELHGGRADRRAPPPRRDLRVPLRHAQPAVHEGTSRVRSHCRFINRHTGSASESGIQWMIGRIK